MTSNLCKLQQCQCYLQARELMIMPASNPLLAGTP